MNIAYSPSPVNGLRKGVIAIVDDDESIRTATSALLRSAGYQVVTFGSAETFLESDALQVMQCLILDVRMRGIDGLELQRRLNRAGSRVPIIFVTAHDEKPYRQKAMEAGAAGFFRKPFDAHTFVAAIQEVTNEPRASDSVSFLQFEGLDLVTVESL